MAVKTFQTRIKNKIDSFTNFIDFIPLNGELLIGKELSSNTLNSPFIAKVGDGTTKFQNLPILGQLPLIGSEFESDEQSLSSNDLILTLNLTPNKRRYMIYAFDGNDNVDTITINIPSNAQPSFTEYYVLIINQGNSDILFNGVTCSSLYSATPTIYTRKDYIRAGEFCEVSIKIFTVSNDRVIVAIPNFSTGQDFYYNSGTGIGTWYVDKDYL